MVVGRPSKDEMFMQLAHVVSQRSTCQRAHVGAIITNWDGTSIKSMGYNGNARGLPDACDTTTPGLCGCLHAEENALLKAPYGPELTMYTTVSPCLACAKRILNSSVRRIVYDESYRDDAGLRQLCEPRLGLEVDRVGGMSWWNQKAEEAADMIITLRQENKHAKNIISCLMLDLNPNWKPGVNAAARAWGERDVQDVIDSQVIISTGPVPLSIKVEVR